MKSTSSLDLSAEIAKIAERLPNQEYTLCKGLKQPFNNTNSGSRKIMQGIQMDQSTQLLHPEAPIIMTGYETQFGEMSSNYIVADKDYVVVGKISKFSNIPNDHYWLILYSQKDHTLDMVERVSYNHVSEFYGYLYDNEYLDSININSSVKEGTVLKKPISYDDYNNKAEGLNLVTIYAASEEVKEDPIVISQSAAQKFSCPLIDKVEIRINDNDILLNLYGQGPDEYKAFPDIGEKVQKTLICALRRELKDEALFSQSWERLKQLMMTDKPFIVDDGGTIIDIDVFCNNPEKLKKSMYNYQIYNYYEETIRFATEFVNTVSPYIYGPDGERNSVEMSYKLKNLFYRCESIANSNGSDTYIYDKVFSNIIMYVYVLHEKPLHKGDKVTDRYGGKGCISNVRPDNMMPHYLKDGKWQPIDVIYSMCTCINRLNDGQLFETSLTFIGGQIIEYIKSNKLNYDQAYELLHRYIAIVNPQQAEYLDQQYLKYYGSPDIRDNNTNLPAPYEDDNRFDRDMWIESILHAGYIMLSMEPISSNMSIDKLKEVYRAFPFIKKYAEVCVPIQGSDGNYRMAQTRRPLVVGYKYIFRLKQLAEEKFSAVSLASTNIRNENSKSRLNKTHNARFASTPVRVFGEMESSTLAAHLGINFFYQEFMLISSSPMARRLHEHLLTGDPFKFDIKLDEDCTSQTSDIGQAYLKTLGARFRFVKIKKFKRRPVLIHPVSFRPMVQKRPVIIIPDDIRGDKEREDKYIKDLLAADEKQKSGKLKQIVKFLPEVEEIYKEEQEYNKKLKELKIKK